MLTTIQTARHLRDPECMFCVNQIYSLKGAILVGGMGFSLSHLLHWWSACCYISSHDQAWKVILFFRDSSASLEYMTMKKIKLKCDKYWNVATKTYASISSCLFLNLMLRLNSFTSSYNWLVIFIHEREKRTPLE